jgi:hypothetical protein
MWLLLWGCNDYQLTVPVTGGVEGEPEILVSPLSIDFAAVSVGDSAVGMVTVQNVGTGLLTVEAPVITDEPVFSTEAPSVALGAGESVELPITFTPAAPSRYEGTLPVRSNDPLTPEVEVSLSGGGLGPWLVISPPSVALGEVLQGCGDQATFTIQNVGTDTVILSALDVDGDAQWSILDAPTLPLSLTPGAYTTATLDLLSESAGATAAALIATPDSDQDPISAEASAEVTAGSEVTDTFRDEVAGPVDVLFAVDQSCSMDDDAALLGASFSTFIQTLQTGTADWQLGVVTYDTGCLNGGILTPQTPSLEAVFAAAVVAGDDREISDDEALLQLSERALSLSAEGECNAGFLRADAALHIIVVSDEPERSPEQASAWTWDYWLAELTAHAEPLVVSGVIDTEGCSEGAAGYLDIINETGGEALSICSGDWSDYAETLAAASLGWLYDLTLSQAPIEETITVSIDGTELTGGWRYDAGLNAVVIDALEEGSEVTVRYRVAEACP